MAVFEERGQELWYITIVVLQVAMGQSYFLQKKMWVGGWGELWWVRIYGCCILVGKEMGQVDPLSN